MTSEADQLLLKNNSKLSQADINTYNINKQRLFRFTIATCIIYGVIALAVLIITILSDTGNKLFTEEIQPFTLTFTGGMIFVIILLIVQIVTFKPKALTINTFDKDICPDFWKLVPTDTTNDTNYTSANTDAKNFMKYKCVPNNNILNINHQSTNSGPPKNSYGQSFSGGATNNIGNGNTQVSLNANPDNLALTKLIAANDFAAGVGNTTLQCNNVYPNYLAYKTTSDKDIQNTPNALACEYAKQCGIPWTSQCGM